MSRIAPPARHLLLVRGGRALCVLAGAALLLHGCSSQPLDPWHTDDADGRVSRRHG